MSGVKQVPFKRALAMMDKIAEIMTLPVHLQQVAFSQMVAYESRGHGIGTPLGSGRMCRTNYERPIHNAPKHENGKREIARRLRQADRV